MTDAGVAAPFPVFAQVTEAVSRSIITGITVRDVAEWEKELHRIAEANQFVLPARIRRMHGAAF